MKNKQTPSLGELENQIMDIMWKCDCATVRCVMNSLKKKKNIAYTTVMTVMARLSGKNLLKRKKDESGAYVYCSCVSKQEYQERISRKMIEYMIKEYGDVAISQFIRTLDSASPEDIKKWKEKLKQLS